MDEQRLYKRKRKALSDGNSTALAAACIDLAELYSKKGQYEDAVKEYKTVADVYKESNNMLDYARANRMIGEAYTQMRKYEKALKCQQIYLDVAKQQNDKLEQQRALATIGHTYLTSYLDNAENKADKSILNLAYRSFMKSLMVCESLTGISKREHMDMSSRLFSNLGIVQECLGNFEKGIELVQKSINICKTHDIFEQLERGYTSLASLYTKKQSYKEAIHNLNLAMDVAKRLDDKANLMGASLLAKSEILIKLDDFHGAKSVLLKAHKLKTPNLNEREQIATNLRIVAAVCYTQDSLLTTSDTDYKKTKSLYEKLGDGCCALKNYSKGIEYYSKMLEAALKNNDTGKDLSTCYISLAQTYLDDKKYDLAVKYFYRDYELFKGNPKESVSTLLSITEAMDSGGKSCEEIKKVYEQALKECDNTDTQLCGKVLTRYLNFLKKNNLFTEANNIESRLSSLNYIPSDCDSEDLEENATPNIGDDIDIDDITDESEDSDVEKDLNKPRTSRKRARGFVIKRNNKGETQLHTACISGNATLVRRLLDQGHPVNIRDHAGWLPIHEACICGHIEIVQMLQEKGAYINDRGGTLCNGMTPLHDAASNGHLEVIQFLLDRGASAVAKTDDGETPLHILKNWYKTVDLDRNEKTLYENIIERMSYALEKSGSKIEPRVSNKENVALVLDESPTNSKRKTKTIAKKSPLKVENKNNDRRRMAEKNNSDEDSDQDRKKVSKRYEISSESSSESSTEEEDASNEYRKVIQSFRTRHLEGSSKKRKSTEKIPAILNVNEFVDDDWLDDDLNINKSKKRRTNSLENCANPSTSQNKDIPMETDRLSDDQFDFDDLVSSTSYKSNPRKKQQSLISAGFTRRRSSASPSKFESNSSNTPLKRKNQKKLTDFKHIRNIAEADSTSAISSSQRLLQRKSSSGNLQSAGGSLTQVLPDTILTVDVRIDGRLYRVPIPLSETNTCNIKWLAEEAAKRYCKKECIKPTLELESKNGAVLAEDDLVSILFPMGSTQAEEVIAKIVKWNVPPLIERYKENCTFLNVCPDDALMKILQGATTVLNLSNLVLRDRISPLCKAINRQNNLLQLDLSGNLITDENILLLSHSLPSLKNLAILNLKTNHISSVGIKYISDMFTNTNETILTNLVSLNLSHNPLENDSFKYLANILVHLKITKLELCDVDFEKGIFDNYNNRNVELNLKFVEHLDISHNGLDSFDIIKFVSWLDTCKIEYLDISSNRLTETDLIRELVQKLDNSNLKLKHLGLARCNVTDSEIYELLRVFINTNIDHLNLSYNDNITAISLRRLLQHSSLFTSLNLTGCRNILKYFDDCTGSMWNILDDNCKKLKNIKLSIDYLRNGRECDILIDLWKNEHKDSCVISKELNNFLELSVCDK